MRRYALVSLVAMLLLPLLACLPATRVGGTATGTRNYNLAGFTRVGAESGIRLDIRQADSYSVAVTGREADLRDLRVERRGNTLTLDFRRPGIFFFTRRDTVQATITMPALEGLELSGGSRATITGFASDRRFDAELSGGSRLDGDVQAGDTRLTLSGGSRAALRGGADHLRLVLSGGSRLDGYDYTARSADADLSGGSRAELQVTEALDYGLSGGSRLDYRGDPVIGRASTSGGAQARPLR